MLAALLLGAGCEQESLGPGEVSPDGRIAFVVPGSEPMLYIQAPDGSGRFRVRFEGAVDRIRGNVPPDLLPVTDAQIKAIGPLAWSPDGQSLAVVLTLAYDQSQVVIVDAQGGNARTASINTQIILSDVAWSADGKRIAYTMSTLPHALGIDVFMTELASDSVRRLTFDAHPGIAGVELAWAADGKSLFWTRFSGSQREAGVENPLTTVERIDLATGARSTEQIGLVGRATGLARGGEWLLLVRYTAFDGTDYERVLVRHGLAQGSEQVLLRQSERVLFAELTPGQCRAVVAVDEGTQPGSPSYGYRILPTRGGAAEPVLQGEGEAAAVDAWFEREAC